MMKRFAAILSVGILFALASAVAYGFFLSKASDKAKAEVASQVNDLPNDAQSQFLKPQVLGDSTQKNEAMFSSENYQIKQLSFGGEIALADGSNNDNIQITDMHSELLMTKDQKDYRFLISWKTNKLATSEISYGKTGAATKTLVEGGYGFTHGIVISQLEMSSAYTYVIKTSDQWGNSVVSDRYAMYTSARALSVFDLITKEFTGMFGWAMKN